MDQLFPRDLYGRIALALASLFFGPIFGVLAIASLCGRRPQGVSVLEGLFLAIAGELFVALTLFFICGLVWALATPRWLERLLKPVAMKLFMALGLFLIPFGILAAWALVIG